MGKMFKKAIGGITKPNPDPITSGIFPRQANWLGGALAFGGVALAVNGNEILKGRNSAKTGRVSYMDGPARMTSSFTSGAVKDMHRIANGNYGVFEDMATEVVASQNAFGRVLDDYGANGKLISALYHMGG